MRNFYQPEKKATHKIPSGMGGVHHLMILAENDVHCDIKIISKNTDFHNLVYKNITKASLIKL